MCIFLQFLKMYLFSCCTVLCCYCCMRLCSRTNCVTILQQERCVDCNIWPCHATRDYASVQPRSPVEQSWMFSIASNWRVLQMRAIWQMYVVKSLLYGWLEPHWFITYSMSSNSVTQQQWTRWERACLHSMFCNVALCCMVLFYFFVNCLAFVSL